MESVKKWLADRKGKKNGLYVHYSPPKLLGVVTAAQLRHWARSGAENRLERAILAGQGHRLLAEAEALPLSRYLTKLIYKCDALHAAVEKGSLLELQELLDTDYNRNKYVTCCDEAGVGLLHKAVYYDYMEIVDWLVKNYPQLVHQKDSEGRTALHYTAACRDEAAAAALLQRAGAARGARDAAGRTLAHYRAERTLLALPAPADMPARPNGNAPGLVIKRHNIRIWCHECDMGRLQRVVWEGHGSRLLSEVSNQPVVKRFLEAVPYIMNTIRDTHNAVIQNDLEGLMKLTADPIPPQALSSRDPNNLTVTHKAAGLGHGGMLKYIIERYPQGINDVDNDGRTPLHYAATVKDDQHTFNTLVSFGADESAVDNKNKTPAYYINRPQEIDKNLLKVLPEAPRTPSSAYPSNWDWKLLDNEFIADLNKKHRKKHLRASNENISSKNNTSTISESIGNHINTMKGSSTHELINNLPELEEMEKTNDIKNDAEIESKEDVEVVEENEVNQNQEQENEETNDATEEKSEEQHENEEQAEQSNDLENDEKSNIDDNEIKHSDDEQEENMHENNKDEEQSNGKIHNDEEIGENNQELTNNENDTDNIDEEKDHSENENATEIQTNDDEQIKQDMDSVIDKENLYSISNNNTKDENADDSINHNGDSNTLQENGHYNDVIENHSKFSNDEPREIQNAVHNVLNTENITAEDIDAASTEGNNNGADNEDDDDVQAQGDTITEHIEHSDIRIKSATDVYSRGSAKKGNLTSGRNTQESLIEGIINSEAEQDSQDASITRRQGSVHGDILIVDNEIDPEVTDLINTTNMEMLATLVLNGEGSRLIGRRSGNSELQAFLENVPTYMQKINRVHVAAREGNIRDLQAALDRRKFAIARDPISPNGATPLHVATVYGKTNIMKYLGGRFPETLSAVDFEGRTALHYAAVLPDNGHYYNLLQQLGANSKDLDDNGHSAEEYYTNPSLLPYNQLLSDYGIDQESAREMLSDKVPEDRVSSRRILNTPEALDTLERCYRLLVSARPSRTPLSASSNKAAPPVVLSRFMRKPIFDLIKHRVTKLDHDLFDVIWPAVKKLPDNRNVIQIVEEDFPGGITAPDYYVYEVFAEFLIPLIKDLHNINIHSEIPIHPISDFIKDKPFQVPTEPLVELNIDPSDEFVLSGTIECSRNLAGFELPLNLKIGKLESIERILTTILMQDKFAKFIEQLSPESEQKGGNYYTLNEVMEKPSEVCATLASSGLLIALCDRDEIDDSARLHGKHWPYGRGVYVSDDKTFAVWINIHDHLRVLISTPLDSPGEIGLPFSKLSSIMTYLHERIDFVWDDKLGHLSSRPTFLGAGIRFSLIVNFPGLAKDSENMKHLCAMRGLQYRETLSADIARISNYQCLSMTETNCFNDFATATSNLLHLEKDLSMHNSPHIGTMISNIFRRKRSSMMDLESPSKEPYFKH